MIRSALLAVTAALCPLTALADDQTLDIAAPFELKGLDPALSGDIFLRLEIAETLVDSDAKGRLRPALRRNGPPRRTGWNGASASARGWPSTTAPCWTPPPPRSR